MELILVDIPTMKDAYTIDGWSSLIWTEKLFGNNECRVVFEDAGLAYKIMWVGQLVRLRGRADLMYVYSAEFKNDQGNKTVTYTCVDLNILFENRPGALYARHVFNYAPNKDAVSPAQFSNLLIDAIRDGSAYSNREASYDAIPNFNRLDGLTGASGIQIPLDYAFSGSLMDYIQDAYNRYNPYAVLPPRAKLRFDLDNGYYYIMKNSIAQTLNETHQLHEQNGDITSYTMFHEHQNTIVYDLPDMAQDGPTIRSTMVVSELSQPSASTVQNKRIVDRKIVTTNYSGTMTERQRLVYLKQQIARGKERRIDITLSDAAANRYSNAPLGSLFVINFGALSASTSPTSQGMVEYANLVEHCLAEDENGFRYFPSFMRYI